MHKLNSHDLITALGDVLEYRIRAIVDNEIKNALDERDLSGGFDIEDYRGDIETMISEYINYNVTVTLEG